MYKKLFALTITSTLSISSLIGTGIVLLNQNNNKNLVTHYNYNKSSEELPSIDDAKKQGIKIRTNPINGFDSLDVSNEKKLVLTTVEKTGELKTYGVALVNFESNEMLDHWEIPNDVPPEQPDKPEADNSNNTFFVKKNKISDKPYVVNYTTNIIPGNNPNEFFVLAGISNLADALNTVYTEYNERETTFEKVVGANIVKDNLKKAPCIRIFKIKIENNKLIGAENDVDKDWWYNFEYPEFDDKHEKGGLKFYTETGVFASFKTQQYGYAGEGTSYGMGYLQYLQYGQLFQVNYKNKDKDEFALINSWLSNDVSMGNLYAFYSTTTESLAPALSIIEYFYKDVLEPMIKDPGNNKPYQPKGDEEDTTKGNEEDTTNYQIITKINDDNYEPAPKSDQLNKNTALALAFMYDFYAGPADLSEKHPVECPTIGSSLNNKKEDHPYYGFVPGWFVFRPIDNYLIYGNTSVNGNYHNVNSIWGTAIGSYWNLVEKKYYLLMVRNLWWEYRSIENIEFIQIDLFADSACSKSDLSNYGTFHVHYDKSSIKIFDYKEYDVKFGHATKPMFIKVIDNEKNIVAIATNATNQILISKKVDKRHDTYLTNMTDLSDKNIWLNMQYNKHTDTLIAINNEKIVTFVINNYNNDNVKLHPYTISSDNIYVSINDVTSGNGQDLDNSRSYIKAFQLTINNGFANSNVTNDIKDLTNHFMIQTATSSNGSKIIGIHTPAELGYSITKNIEKLKIEGTTKWKPTDILLKPIVELKDTFDANTSSTLNATLIGYKVTNTSTFSNNKSGYFRLVSIILNDKQMFGFSIIEGENISNIVTGGSKYLEEDFSKELWYVVFNDISSIRKKDSPCKKWSVEEIVNSFDIDSNDERTKKLMDDIFELIVNEDKSNFADYAPENIMVNIEDSSIATNTISFSIVYYDKKNGVDPIRIPGPNTDGSNAENNVIRLEGIFATKLSSQTIMWIIIGTTLGIAALLALGLGIGIPMRKNAKMTKEGFALSHQKMDTLTAAIGNVFKKMSDVNVKKKTPMLLRDKKQTPSTLKPRSPINSNRPIPSTSKPQSPINSNSRPIPKKPINSVQPKRPIDTSQKSN